MKYSGFSIQRFFACLCLAGLAIASPPIKVSLRSSWTETPLLLEAMETVSLEEPDAFFPLLDKLTDPQSIPSLHALSSEAIHQLVLETALSSGYLQQPGSLAFIELHLALHAAAPKIRAYYQFYNDHNFTTNLECESWVDWYGERVCDLENLKRLANQEMIDSSDVSSNSTYFHLARPKVLQFDHINPSPHRTLEPPTRTAILYATLDSPNFRELHSYLLMLSSGSRPRLEYVFRHKPSSKYHTERKSYLSGYGVFLDLKKTDYLVVDDRHSTSTQDSNDHPSSDSEVSLPEDTVFSLLQDYPENSTIDANAPLDESEILDLGLKSTQFILNSTYPLLTLLQLSQNFPKYATTIARKIVISDNLREETLQNEIFVPSGACQLWLNGHTVSESDLNPFGLLRLLRKERNIVLSLVSLGLTTSQAIDLITHPIIHEVESESGVLDGRVDASDRIEGGSVIIWWNDLTKDSRYSRWTPSLSALLRPVYPGQFQNVKLNIYNLVLILDLSQSTNLNFIGNAMNNLINRNLPFRFGVVPIMENEGGVKFAKLFYYLIDNYGRSKTMRFISLVSQRLDYYHHTSVDWDIVQSVFETFVNENSLSDGQHASSLEAIVDFLSEDVNLRVENARSYANRLAADLFSSPTGHAFLNGRHMVMGDEFLKSLQVEMMDQMHHLQEKIYLGLLSESDAEHIDSYFYDLPHSSIRRSRYVHTNQQKNNLVIVNMHDIFTQVGYIPPSSAFLYPMIGDEIPLTTIIVADLDSSAGLSLMLETITSLDNQPLSRLLFLHNPSTRNTRSKAGSISALISYLTLYGVLSKLNTEQLKDVLELTFSSSESATSFISDETTQFFETQGINLPAVDIESVYHFIDINRLICRELDISLGTQAIIINGRVVTSIGQETFSSFDYDQLRVYELRRRVKPVQEALANMSIYPSDYDRATYGNLLSMASSVISSIQQPDPSEQGLFNTNQRPRQRNYRHLHANFTGFNIGDESTAIFHFGILVDPLSESAQKWSSLMMWLSNIPHIYAEFYINPAPHSEIPIKRFYRYNLRGELSFGEDGAELPAQTIVEELPIEPIYTLGLDVPSSWLVRPREAYHDLDNIQLATLAPEDRILGIEAIYELDFLVIEGHARDVVTNLPPRGLQLQLLGIDSIPIAETLVVATLGYMQFKATPGVFQLYLREGRGRDIYDMESVGDEGWNSPVINQSGADFAVTSFEGLTLYPRVRRRLGMERVDVLDESVVSEDVPKSIFSDVASRISSFFQPKNVKNDSQEIQHAPRQAEINIFTVASGLLYERFASIMILSVLRNTKSSVKFWFIENFLSPSFLEFIPHFAEAYEFDYELVTYKWPSWLRAQKEKQRIIWAYKILFLDVLFPLDLKRIIFVDADQIVRADLKELVDLDLRGAPYGYTPMGDDNPDTEGFRFWKTGYWKDFLHGRPYHISALYVIDLVRFRQLAAGDILRSQYHQLSADPNSLANLDQDLPNNLQQELPIYSLHEDWLWCETWCSKERLHRAKTIDLCQNPLTREPKLARARQIPEWEVYDDEVAQFARRLASTGKIRSSIVTIDVSALANAGSGTTIIDTAGMIDGVDDPKETTQNTVEDQTHDEL